MKKSLAKPATRPTHLLAADLRVTISQLSRRLREQATAGDFTASQKSVVLRLDRHGPATVTALAFAEHVKPQSMGATVSSLEALGLVDRTPDPADGRQTILSLNAKARELIRASRAAREDWLHRTLNSKLTRDEQTQLATAIALLNRLLES